MRNTIPVIVLAVVLAGCASAPEPPPVAEGLPAAVAHIEQYAEFEASRMREGGLAIVAAADGRIVLSDGFGYADDDSKRPITGDTAYRVGSITKLFTAISVMQLVEQGLVDLDEPFATYVPDFSIQSREVGYPPFTVRDMLTHQAGLPGDVFNGWVIDGLDAPGSETAYREYIELGPDLTTTMPRRTLFSYSNLAMSLLGILIERVSGEDYADYVLENVTGPLGMESATFDVTSDPNLAAPYAAGGMDPHMLARIRDLPAGGLQASLDDMGRFLIALLQEGNPVLSSATFAEMASVQNADVPLDGDMPVGITFWLVNPTSIPDLALISHGGDIPPYHTMLVVAPEEGVGVFVATNSDAGPVIDVAVEALTRLVEARRGEHYPVVDPLALPEQKLPAETLERYTGVWASPMGLVTSRVRRGRLLGQLGPGTVTLVHRGDDLLTAEVRVLGIPLVQLWPLYFRLEEHDGQPLLALYQGGVFSGYAVRFEPEPVPQVWLDRVGEYEILNGGDSPFLEEPELIYDDRTGVLGVRAESVIAGGELVIPIRVLSDSHAVTEGMGRMMGESIRVRDVDGEERLLYSGFEMRRVE